MLYNLAEDPEEQMDLAESEPKKRDALAGRLHDLLTEMQAELPFRNPDFSYSSDKERLYNLESTLNLAERERRMFEKRLGGGERP